MSFAAVPSSPYQGLTPYSEEDARFFFGRDPEREIITANLLASRLRLLYGESGVGKSSVLRAVAAYPLGRLAEANTADRGRPELPIVVFSSWRDDPVRRIEDSLRLIQRAGRRVGGHFLHRVRGDKRVRYRSWAVHAALEPLEREFWRLRGIDVFDVPLEEYLDQLAVRLESEVR